MSLPADAPALVVAASPRNNLILLALVLAMGFLSVGANTASDAAERTPLVVSGQVLNEEGEPVPGSFVQIWQTHPDSGLYDLPILQTPTMSIPPFNTLVLRQSVKTAALNS